MTVGHFLTDMREWIDSKWALEGCGEGMVGAYHGFGFSKTASSVGNCGLVGIFASLEKELVSLKQEEKRFAYRRVVA